MCACFQHVRLIVLAAVALHVLALPAGAQGWQRTLSELQRTHRDL